MRSGDLSITISITCEFNGNVELIQGTTVLQLEVNHYTTTDFISNSGSMKQEILIHMLIVTIQTAQSITNNGNYHNQGEIAYDWY